MGGTCSTDVKQKKFIQILIDIHEGKNHSGNLDVDGRSILECILKN